MGAPKAYMTTWGPSHRMRARAASLLLHNRRQRINRFLFLISVHQPLMQNESQQGNCSPLKSFTTHFPSRSSEAATSTALLTDHSTIDVMIDFQSERTPLFLSFQHIRHGLAQIKNNSKKGRENRFREKLFKGGYIAWALRPCDDHAH